MGENIHDLFVAAMQAYIERNEPFQAKDVVQAGEAVIPAEAEGVMRRLEWGGVHVFINGEPLMRMADKLLQKNRRAGRIQFDGNRWWSAALSRDAGQTETRA